jgi:4-hydroxy-tetrahydrodipicolinate reductase
MSYLQVGLLGATGKMGQAISSLLSTHPTCRLASAYASPRSQKVDTLLPSIPLTESSKSLFEKVQVVIDFTTAAAVEDHLRLAITHKRPLVIGTTGLTLAQYDLLKNAAQHIPVVYAANMSIGITVLKSLLQKAASLLDDSYDVEISETHHRYKRDAPSGTALLLGESVALGRHVNLNSVSKSGYLNGERRTGDIGFSVQRGGGVVGEHTVRFIGDDEEIIFAHRGFDRKLFAKGAIKAAEWIYQQPPGLYSMSDVLGI